MNECSTSLDAVHNLRVNDTGSRHLSRYLAQSRQLPAKSRRKARGRAKALDISCSISQESDYKLPLLYIVAVVALSATLMSFEGGLEQKATNFLQAFVNSVDLKFRTFTVRSLTRR